MSWKQPIPTDLYEIFGDDYAAMNLYIHALLHARNEDMQTPLFFNSKPYLLKKGQFLYGRNQYARYIGLSPSGTDRALMRLQKVYSKVTCERSKNYSIGTVLEYNSEIKMNKQMDKQRTSREQAENTNKSVESVESDKNTILLGEKLESSVQEFILHRKQLRKPMTELALDRMKKKLVELPEEKAIALIELAIEKGWQGIVWEVLDSSPHQFRAPPSSGPAPFDSSKFKNL